LVLYPAINTNITLKYENNEKNELNFDNKIVISSANRYEKKKNIILAIDSFYKVLKNVNNEIKEKLLLIIGGGYDERLKENIEVYNELVNRAKELKIEEKVKFLKNFNNEERYLIFNQSDILLYTPENEHFGIVFNLLKKGTN
jgi:alpha-1,3/alpha-1,6-mannosyltransferase